MKLGNIDELRMGDSLNARVGLADNVIKFFEKSNLSANKQVLVITKDLLVSHWHVVLFRMVFCEKNVKLRQF